MNICYRNKMFFRLQYTVPIMTLSLTFKIAGVSSTLNKSSSVSVSWKNTLIAVLPALLHENREVFLLLYYTLYYVHIINPLPFPQLYCSLVYIVRGRRI